MAVVSICYTTPYHDHVLQTQTTIRQHERGLMCECSGSLQGHKCSSMFSSNTCGRWQIFSPNLDCLTKTNSRVLNGFKAHKSYKAPALHSIWSSHGENFGMVWHASESSSNEKQLRSLETYLEKLQGNSSEPSSDISEQMTEVCHTTGQINVKKELQRLNAYLGKLNKETSAESHASSSFDEQAIDANPIAKPVSLGKGSIKDDVKRRSFTAKDLVSSSRKSIASHKNDDVSDLYLIGLLASINIAVFLFEIASPMRNPEFGLFTLPLVYGAKINDLIMGGEWWRLVTPMFLHSGAFHVGLGCWSLLTFGPHVCRGYGSFTFFLIYILGGFSGNLISFLHTPEPSVGGTGPIFAIIGAWLIYQTQNRDVISKEVAEGMFQKAMFTTAACFILSHFGPIDDWTHLGAVLTGIVYGFFTCPTLQLDDVGTRRGQDEGITLVGRHADPCKSVLMFAIVVLVLSSLLFVLEPPLETIGLDDIFE